jgi:hypothetical protein
LSLLLDPDFGGRERDDDVTKPYSVAFKERMVRRLIGKNPVSAMQLARETGVRQQNLSRWLADARSFPVVASDKPKPVTWTVEQKARILAETAKLDGERLTAYLTNAGVKLAEVEDWRLALEGTATATASRRIRKLERELARKDKALAEAAALLVLQKKVRALYQADEDDDTDEGNET